MNETNLPSFYNKSFEELKGINQYDAEYWSARDLQPLLGYNQWRSFESVINKAMVSCQNAGQKPDDHFAQASKQIVNTEKKIQEAPDYHLSRFACYLIAQNGDPQKPEIVNAQTYFYFAPQMRRQKVSGINRKKLQKESIEPEPPKILRNILWIKIHGRKHWKLLVIAGLVLFISSGIFVLPRIDLSNLCNKISKLPKAIPNVSGGYKIEFSDVNAIMLLNDGENEGGDEIRLELYAGKETNKQENIYTDSNSIKIPSAKDYNNILSPHTFKENLKETPIFASLLVKDKKDHNKEIPIEKNPKPVDLKGNLLIFNGKPVRNNEVHYIVTYKISQKGGS